MRLDEIDPPSPSHRTKSRTTTQPAPVKQPPVTHKGQSILPALNPSGSWPLPSTQTTRGVSADFPVSTLASPTHRAAASSQSSCEVGGLYVNCEAVSD
jgi:hypothetical protein